MERFRAGFAAARIRSKGCPGTPGVSRSGVEMEALTAVSIAALTIYDMCKAADKKMRIEGVRLVRKTKADHTASVL